MAAREVAADDEMSQEKSLLSTQEDNESSSDDEADKLPLIDIEERWTSVAVDALCVLATCIPLLSFLAVCYLFYNYSAFFKDTRRRLLNSSSPHPKKACLLWFWLLEVLLWLICFLKSMFEVSTYTKIYARFHVHSEAQGKNPMRQAVAEAVGADLLFTTCYVVVPLLQRVMRIHMLRVGHWIEDHKKDSQKDWVGAPGDRANKILGNIKSKFQKLFREDGQTKDVGDGCLGSGGNLSNDIGFYRSDGFFVPWYSRGLVVVSTLCVCGGLAYLQWTLGHNMYRHLQLAPDLVESAEIAFNGLFGGHNETDHQEHIRKYRYKQDEGDVEYDLRWYCMFLLPGIVCVVQATFYWFILAATFVVATTNVNLNTDRLLVFTALTKESKLEMWTKKNRDRLRKILVEILVENHPEYVKESDSKEVSELFEDVWDQKQLDLQEPGDVQAWWLMRQYMHIDFNDESASMDFCGIAVVVLMFSFAVAGFLVWINNEIDHGTFGLFLLIFLLNLFLIGIMNDAFTACIQQNLLLERDARVLVDATLSTLMKPGTDSEAVKKKEEVSSLHQAIQRKIELYDDKQRLFGIEVTANLRNSLLLYAVSTASAAVWKFIADLRGDVDDG
ncbi:unnamed protein product [Symbiodinium sp. CCMP2456]|nr:unnamed protein product [Symbiodinium sp. CCMP2456]